MTISLLTPADLRFNDLVNLDGRPFAVRTRQPSRITYKGRTVPVVFVTGVSSWEGRVKYTLLPGQELFVSRPKAGS